MNNEPVAWINRKGKDGEHGYLEWDKDDEAEINTPLYTHPVNPKYDPETGEPLIDGYPLFSGLPHPVKELHLSLQKSKETGELLAVTYTDDEHRIVEVLWQRPPVKELALTDEEILECWNETHPAVVCLNAELPLFARAILRKAQK